MSAQVIQTHTQNETEPFVLMPKKQLETQIYRHDLARCYCVCVCVCGLPIVFFLFPELFRWMIFRVRNQIKTIFSSSACSNELASAFASTEYDSMSDLYSFYQQFCSCCVYAKHQSFILVEIYWYFFPFHQEKSISFMLFEWMYELLYGTLFIASEKLYNVTIQHTIIICMILCVHA